MKKLLLILLLLLIGCASETNSTTTSTTTTTEPELIIYDVHEQIQHITDIPKFLEAMDKAEVDKIVLLGTPEATFLLNEGFKKHKENNLEMMQIAEQYPDRFIVMPTVDPRDIDMDAFESHIQNGALGLRLFSGQYAYFYKYIGPVNRTELYPILNYCSDNDLPVMYNMNPGKEDLQQQFEDILQRYPDVQFVCPHFCLSTIANERFEYLMDTYPNLWTDISFGHFFKEGLERISNDPEKFNRLFNKYQDRIMFGIDMVITEKTGDSSDWIYNLTMCYRDMMEKQTYDCTVKVGRVFDVEMKNTTGLNLDKEILRKVYQENAEEWLGIT